MLELKQSATDKVIPFPMVSFTHRIKGSAGPTPAMLFSQTGGVFAAPDEANPKN